MRRALRLHPDCRRDAVNRIDVEVANPQPQRLILHYVLTGRVEGVVLAEAGEPSRADELWRHTCFELFIRPAGGSGYYEFNFAPSRHWAVYHFDDYRSAMAPFLDLVPQIAVAASPGRFELTATIDLPRLSDEPLWKLALCAVVEETGGQISYWALQHPSGKPDFHHADSFALELQGQP